VGVRAVVAAGIGSEVAENVAETVGVGNDVAVAYDVGVAA
jgi:hypothetical protein